MRKILCLALVLVFILLAGCLPSEKVPLEDTLTRPTKPPTEPVPTEPPLPDVALKMYPNVIPESCIGFCMMGNDLVLFENEDAAHLTVLNSTTMEPTASADLACPMYPSSSHIQVTDSGVSYYDERKGDVVMLNTQLQETNRVYLGDHDVLMSPDGHTVCYRVNEEIRLMDITTGISRLLRIQQTHDFGLSQLLFDGSILIISQAEEGEAENKLVAVSTEDGHTLYTNNTCCWIDEANGLWITPRYEDAYTQYLFAYRAESVQEFYAPVDDHVMPLPQLGGILASEANETHTRLTLYDLRAGLRSAELRTNEFFYPWYYQAAPNGSLWIMADSAPGEDPTPVLARWYPPLSPTDDDKIYTSPRRTEEHPDEAGLARCVQRADEIGKRFGVQIRLWKDALDVDAPEYDLAPEYRVPTLHAAMDALEAALESYPYGFLEQLSQYAGSDGIQIDLLRSIQGKEDYDVVSEACGVQQWTSSQAVILLSTAFNSGTLQRTVYHELYHIADSRILSTCSALDEWSKLNPKGFDYDYSYREPREYEEYSRYLEGNAAFIDIYSMSYPSEDRCRIMENAMTLDNGDCFESAALQAKLKAVCGGMRKAFDLPESQDLIWEQYLKTE